MMGSGIRIFLFASLVVQGQTTERIHFDRKYTGVEIYPYITADGVKERPDKSTYTTENVRTMLKVVSTKFSRIFHQSFDVHNDVYERNDTYYYGTHVAARTAEMAAHINRERNNLSLTVTIGVVRWSQDSKFTAEMDVALEAFQISQTIFPGTVEGLLISDVNSLEEIKSTNSILKDIIALRKKFSTESISIGLGTSCDLSLRRSILRADSAEVLSLKKKVLLNLDFIMCSIAPDATLHETKGTMATFNAAESRMLAQREDIKYIDNSIQVTWYTWWKPPNDEELNKTKYHFKYISDFRDYWFHIDRIATQNNYPGWLQAAIRDHDNGPRGWWKLTNQRLINNVSGYKEYISELPEDYSNNNNLRTSDTQATDGTKEENNQTMWIYVAVIIGSLFSAIALSLLAYMKCKKRNLSDFQILTRQEIDEFRHGIVQNDYNQTGDESFVNVTALKQPYDRLLEIPRDKLEILTNQILGGGEFGCVFKALVKGEADKVEEVALKTTKPNCASTAIKGLLSEIKILSYLEQHPNIVPIIGAYTAEISRGTVYLATELCPLGSLKTCLKNCHDSTTSPDPSEVPLHDMIRWSYEIACGMEYLELKGVIHADLATRNVLLSSESVAKITDFGLSRRLYEYTNYTKTSQEPLPWRWMAPESLKMMEFSTKSDVWSYGVTLWEIFSLGSQPYPGLTWTVDFVETLEDGLRLKQPRHAPSEIFEIMNKCWILDKNSRPSFTKLKKSMQSVKANVTESLYTKLTVDHNE